MQLSASGTLIQQKLTRLSVLPAVLVIAIALLVLTGWSFNIEVFKRPLPHLAAMNPMSATAFIFSAVAFVFFSATMNFSFSRLAGNVLAIMVLLTGLLRLIGMIWNLDTQIDTLLFNHKLQRDIFGNISNRMAPNTAANFIFTGAALLLQKNGSSRYQKLPQGLAIIIASLGFFSLLGYLYKVREFYGVLNYIPMAIHTAICFLLLSVAILMKKPADGFMKDFTGSLTGSASARLLIPVVIIIPVVLGYLWLMGYWAGIFSTEFGVVALVLSITIVFLLVIWYNVILLNKKDRLQLEAEYSLIQSEKRIQAIFDAAPDAVIVIDEEGKIVRWNPKSELIFGWSKEEAVGMLLSETIIPSRFREAHTKGLARFLQTGEGPVINKTIEIRAINKTNAEFDISLSISPALINNQYFFIGFLRDISEEKKGRQQLKESEERFQKTFQASPAGISITRLSDTTFLDVNDAFVKLTGYTKEELIGRHSTELGMVVSVNKREAVLQQVREQGSIKNFEMAVRSKSGEIREVLSSIETVMMNDEKYAINIIYDITERKKAERELETVNKELEAFSYSVSHDLRAPLRIMDSYAKIIVEDFGDKLDKEIIRSLDKITTNTRKMGYLIDDLLNFSRLGRKELNFRRVDMTGLVESIFAEQQLLLAGKATMKLEKLEPALCDGNLIQQVWINFISNAIKYSSQREESLIEIKSHVTDNEIIYSIKDNGIGFDMKYADKLFGVFQRLHNTSEFEGTGVGLALVERIISRHVGRVWAEAEINKGATFYFSLPVVQGKIKNQ